VLGAVSNLIRRGGLRNYTVSNVALETQLGSGLTSVPWHSIAQLVSGRDMLAGPKDLQTVLRAFKAHFVPDVVLPIKVSNLDYTRWRLA